MFDKLEDLLIRFEEIMGELNEPDVTANQERFRALMKEQSDLTPIVEAYREYKKCNQDIEDSLMMLDEENDPDMREMLKEELNSAKTRVSELEEELKILLLPKDPNDEKNVIVEIRAGAGGDEAALFAAEIYRMYVRYAERQRWRVETMDVERCAPSAACAGDGERRQNPHLDDHGCDYAGGRGFRRADRYERL